MTDEVNQRVGAMALNSAIRLMRESQPMVSELSYAQWLLLVPAFVRRTPDEMLLYGRNLGRKSLARLRAAWPYDPPPVMRCPCCNQPLPPPETPLGE